jgi:hypothetical protein
MKICVYLWQNFADFFLQREIFRIKFLEKIKNIPFSKTFLKKLCLLSDNMEKYGTARQPTEGNRAQTHCMLDNYGYKHKLRLCNTYCFSKSTMVRRKRLDVTLHVHCLHCYIYFLPRGYIIGVNTRL